jgi:hypothetical protein
MRKWESRKIDQLFADAIFYGPPQSRGMIPRQHYGRSHGTVKAKDATRSGNNR